MDPVENLSSKVRGIKSFSFLDTAVADVVQLDDIPDAAKMQVEQMDTHMVTEPCFMGSLIITLSANNGSTLSNAVQRSAGSLYLRLTAKSDSQTPINTHGNTFIALSLLNVEGSYAARQGRIFV